MSFKWTDENFQKLKKLWAKGMSAREIAEKIGTTRNAIIGKANRSGLSSPTTKVKAKATKSVKAAKATKKAPTPSKEVIQISQPANTASENACQWPIGDPGTPEFKFCYEPAKPGRPYCEEHCNIAYRNIN
ncbi:MAG: GcrA family cell cycle regulator [Alphaproteobacteria bacterium]